MEDTACGVLEHQLDVAATIISNSVRDSLQEATDRLARGGSEAILAVNAARGVLEGNTTLLGDIVRTEFANIEEKFIKEMLLGEDIVDLAIRLMRESSETLSEDIGYLSGINRQTMDAAVDIAINSVTSAHAAVLENLANANRLLNLDIATIFEQANADMEALASGLVASTINAIDSTQSTLDQVKEFGLEAAKSVLGIVSKGVALIGNPLDFLFNVLVDLVTEAFDMSPETLKSAADTIMGIIQTPATDMIESMRSEVEG